jgi:hypothetical protein
MPTVTLAATAPSMSNFHLTQPNSGPGSLLRPVRLKSPPSDLHTDLTAEPWSLAMIVPAKLGLTNTSQLKMRIAFFIIFSLIDFFFLFAVALL